MHCQKQLVRLALWNLAEKKEGTQLVNSNHFMGVHGALIVTDVAQPHTIARMVQWKGLVDNTVAEVCACPQHSLQWHTCYCWLLLQFTVVVVL
jgi:hypothetical protein